MRTRAFVFVCAAYVFALTSGGCGDDSAGNNNNINQLDGSAEVCGNGLLEEGEACDDGENNSDSQPDACRSDCRLPYCGDGVADSNQECDGDDFQGETCQSLGLTAGTLACDSNCLYDLTTCSGCGNGTAEVDEECDLSDVRSQTCADVTSYEHGIPSCTSECLLDTSACHTCGNGVAEGTEECDDQDVAGATCDSVLGFQDGTLTCDAQCLFDSSDCHACGNDTAEGPEACDGQDLVSNDCSTVSGGSLPDGQLACASGCDSFDTGGCNNCGNAQVEGAEACDGQNFNGETCADAAHGSHADGTLSCSGSCLSISSAGCHTCGDGICETGPGETVATCPADCGWVAVAGGGSHTCGLKGDGTVWCWGGNGDGQLGANTPGGLSTTPVQVVGLSDVDEIAAGWNSSCALVAGDVYCWGNIGGGQTPTQVSGLAGVTRITVGGTHACAVAGSDAFCWGSNSFGQLGDGSTTPSTTPVPVSDGGGTYNFGSISAGGSYTCAAQSYTSGGMAAARIACWGAGFSYQLGNGFLGQSETPMSSGFMGFSASFNVGVGFSHSCGVRATMSGSAFKCWGEGNYGKLGNGSTANQPNPTDVTSLTDVHGIEGGSNHTCAIENSTDQVYCWGNNGLGQVGAICAGSVHYTPILVPTMVATDLATGLNHTCAILTDGTMHCWGDNYNGQLGNGLLTPACPSVAVSDPYP